MLLKCCTQYVNKFRKLSSGHGIRKGQLSFQSQTRATLKKCSNYHIIVLISDASKVMLKILQARLQQYVDQEIPDVQAGFRKGRGTRDQIANIYQITRRRQWHPTPVLLPGKSHGWRSLEGCSPRVTEGQTRLSDFPFTFHFHAMEKEMANHSSVLAWRIPGMGEPGGLPSMGSH